MDLSQGADRQAEAAELAKYFSKFSEALTRLDEELARWKNYEADYQALKTTLLDLPKETSHPVMVRDRESRCRSCTCVSNTPQPPCLTS